MEVYALKMMIAEARGIAPIPDELTSVEAAPLLCAGITTYNALRNAGLARWRFRGAGHWRPRAPWRPVWRRMGFRTDRTRARPREGEACDGLGRARLLDTAVDDAVAVLQRMSGARAILATARAAMLWGDWCPVLLPAGKLIVVVSPCDPIQLTAFRSSLAGARSTGA